MIKSYFIVALRNLFRNKVYSFLNISGLALGLACCIFILLWVQDELSYDRFYENAENLYRVEENQYYSGETYHVNVTPYPSAPVFKSDIPEVVNAARITYHSVLIRYKDKSFYESEIVAADQSYLDMFGSDFVSGSRETALSEPNSIVMTKEMSEKYFGDEEPLGKIVTINNKYDFKVTGIMEKIPSNASYRYKAAFPFALGEIPLDVPQEQLNKEQLAGYRLFMTSCISCHDRSRVSYKNAQIEIPDINP